MIGGSADGMEEGTVHESRGKEHPTTEHKHVHPSAVTEEAWQKYNRVAESREKR